MSLIDTIRFYWACYQIAAHEEQTDEGPRPVIISGGEVLELGEQRGGDEIPF